MHIFRRLAALAAMALAVGALTQMDVAATPTPMPHEDEIIAVLPIVDTMTDAGFSRTYFSGDTACPVRRLALEVATRRENVR